MAWEQKLHLLLGALICFVLKVACMATMKIQPSLHLQPTVGQTFCYAVEKNLVNSVHQYNVCVCVCIFFPSFKTMLHKLWFYTCEDIRKGMKKVKWVKLCSVQSSFKCRPLNSYSSVGLWNPEGNGQFQEEKQDKTKRCCLDVSEI